MTRDEIIRMAREAGFRAGHIESYSSDPMPFIGPRSATNCMAEVVRFAAIVAAAEREACAAICDEEANKMEQGAQRAIEDGEHDEVSAIRSTAWKLSVAASRIRKRSEE